MADPLRERWLAATALPVCPHGAMRAGIRARLFFTRAVGALVVALVLTSASYWSTHGSGTLGDVMFATGIAFALAGFGGRLWALRHIGGRKKRELVATGPYSLCRHPLYLCSLVGGLGLALCTQRLSLVLVYLVAKALMLPPAIRAEERFLEHRFPEYSQYRSAVPALFPRSVVVGRCSSAVDVAAFRRGLIEGLAFISPVALLPLVESVQAAGALPVLFLLP